MIRITAKKDGFRRCGIAHSKESTEYTDGTFTKEQLAILQLEPNLVVEIIEGVRLPAADLIEQAKAAETLEALEQLAEGEERKSVIAAIEKRRAELTETVQE